MKSFFQPLKHTYIKIVVNWDTVLVFAFSVGVNHRVNLDKIHVYMNVLHNWRHSHKDAKNISSVIRKVPSLLDVFKQDGPVFGGSTLLNMD